MNENFWTDKDNVKDIVDEVKEVAENALKQTCFAYEPTSGMYYDYNTGYYYDAVSYSFFLISNKVTLKTEGLHSNLL